MTGGNIDLAMEAGLRYVEPGEPGYKRVRRGRGFSYEDLRGDSVNGKTKEWIESLVIPPAWDQVWICSVRDGHMVATGVDKAGNNPAIERIGRASRSSVPRARCSTKRWPRRAWIGTRSPSPTWSSPSGSRRGENGGSKKPTRRHVSACRLWLKAELARVQPDMVVTLGGSAAQAVLGRPSMI